MTPPSWELAASDPRWLFARSKHDRQSSLLCVRARVRVEVGVPEVTTQWWRRVRFFFCLDRSLSQPAHGSRSRCGTLSGRASQLTRRVAGNASGSGARSVPSSSPASAGGSPSNRDDGPAVPRRADREGPCPSCGKLVRRGMKFCTRCGTPLTPPMPRSDSADAARAKTPSPVSSGASSPAHPSLKDWVKLSASGPLPSMSGSKKAGGPSPPSRPPSELGRDVGVVCVFVHCGGGRNTHGNAASRAARALHGPDCGCGPNDRRVPPSVAGQIHRFGQEYGRTAGAPVDDRARVTARGGAGGGAPGQGCHLHREWR